MLISFEDILITGDDESWAIYSAVSAITSDSFDSSKFIVDNAQEILSWF